MQVFCGNFDILYDPVRQKLIQKQNNLTIFMHINLYHAFLLTFNEILVKVFKENNRIAILVDLSKSQRNFVNKCIMVDDVLSFFNKWKPYTFNNKKFNNFKHLLCELEPSSPLPISDIATQHTHNLHYLGKHEMLLNFWRLHRIQYRHNTKSFWNIKSFI